MVQNNQINSNTNNSSPYMQCKWWILSCSTLISFPKVGQAFAALTNQTVNHETICTPLVPEKTTAEYQHEIHLGHQNPQLKSG